jgi:hypothetical protein
MGLRPYGCAFGTFVDLGQPGQAQEIERLLFLCFPAAMRTRLVNGVNFVRGKVYAKLCVHVFVYADVQDSGAVEEVAEQLAQDASLAVGHVQGSTLDAACPARQAAVKEGGACCCPGCIWVVSHGLRPPVLELERHL